MQTSTIPTHRARLNGAVLDFAASDFDTVIPQFVAAHGGGVPQIESLASPAPATPPPPPIVRGTTVDAAGAARSADDAAAATLAGFSPTAPLYTRGTMVVDLGVENARAARMEHDAMPSVSDACEGFLADVQREERHDQTVRCSEIRMDKVGRLVTGDRRLLVHERAFGSFCSRMGFGGGDYLARCWPELRAINVNRWADRIAQDEAKVSSKPGFAPAEVVLRTRNASGGGREVFGVVSDGYAAFDADKVAAAIQLAMPRDAKLRVAYDGFRTRFDVMFHSTVQPESFVAGEFFRAGISIRTDDTGGGSLRGSSFVEQNLCLNLIVIDKAAQPLFALRHLGSVERLADEFRAGLGRAKDSLEHFLRQWGYATSDDLVAAERARNDEPLPQRMEDLLIGFANGAIERDLVPLRARRAETLETLAKCYAADTSSDGPRRGTVTRAGLVNAITRYAHRVEPDPWKGAELERAASALLWPRGRGGLPEIPFVEVAL